MGEGGAVREGGGRERGRGQWENNRAGRGARPGCGLTWGPAGTAWSSWKLWSMKFTMVYPVSAWAAAPWRYDSHSQREKGKSCEPLTAAEA